MREISESKKSEIILFLNELELVPLFEARRMIKERFNLTNVQANDMIFAWSNKVQKAGLN